MDYRQQCRKKPDNLLYSSDREEPASAIWQGDFHNFIWVTANGKKNHSSDRQN